jgi:hypothetical protein
MKLRTGLGASRLQRLLDGAHHVFERVHLIH